MLVSELMALLEKCARKYRAKARESIVRNIHISELSAGDIKSMNKNPELFNRIIDAALVGFLNYLVACQGGDWGLKIEHLKQPMKALMLLHHDDPPCAALLKNGFCEDCGLTPDMQSTCFYYYCPHCKMQLKKMFCSKCKEIFKYR